MQIYKIKFEKAAQKFLDKQPKPQRLNGNDFRGPEKPVITGFSKA